MLLMMLSRVSCFAFLQGAIGPIGDVGPEGPAGPKVSLSKTLKCFHLPF